MLRAEVADEEPPGEFAPGPDILGDCSDELGGVSEQGLG